MTRKHCSTCGGRGTVDKIYGAGMAMGYYNPRTGDTWPQEQCQNCCGQGWIGTPDVEQPLTNTKPEVVIGESGQIVFREHSDGN